MRVEISIPEVVSIFKEIQEQPERIFEMIRFLDGVCFDMRIDGSIENIPVLIAIGVTGTGCKRVLSFQAGDKESAPT